jgi:hypothetical protein
MSWGGAVGTTMTVMVVAVMGTVMGVATTGSTVTATPSSDRRGDVESSTTRDARSVVVRCGKGVVIRVRGGLIRIRYRLADRVSTAAG